VHNAGFAAQNDAKCPESPTWRKVRQNYGAHWLPDSGFRDTLSRKCVLKGNACSHQAALPFRNPETPHHMSKITSLALLSVGVLLLIYGRDASNSISSSVTQAVNGAPTDKSIWLTVLGVVGILSGSVGLFTRRAP
jgi:hypothetical protein